MSDGQSPSPDRQPDDGRLIRMSRERRSNSVASIGQIDGGAETLQSADALPATGRAPVRRPPPRACRCCADGRVRAPRLLPVDGGPDAPPHVLTPVLPPRREHGCRAAGPAVRASCNMSECHSVPARPWRISGLRAGRAVGCATRDSSTLTRCTDPPPGCAGKTMGAAECERLRTTYLRRRRGLRRGCLSATVCVYFPAIGGREERIE